MQFQELFVGGLHARGQWANGQAKTLLGPPTDLEYSAHLGGKVGLGLVPVRADSSCRFSAIDIDVDTINHQDLYAQVQARRLPLHVCRSKSGGAHLYLFCREPGIGAGHLQTVLHQYAALLGYPQAEIFPKQTRVDAKNLGNWINLPYFGADNTTRYGVGPAGALSLADFLATIDFYDEVRATQVDGDWAEVDGMPPCLQVLLKAGLPAGTRNQGLFNFGVYYRKACPTDWQQKVREHNELHVQPPMNAQELAAVIKSLERTKYQYLCAQPPISAHCQRSQCVQLKYGVGHMPWQEDGSFDDLHLGRVRKQLTDPPRYLIEISGRDVELSSEEFLDFSLFRRRLMELLDLVIAPLKQQSWEARVRELLKIKEDLSAPQEASLEGQIIERLLEFIVLRERARSAEDLLRGLPVEADGWVLFRIHDFRRHLKSAGLDRTDSTWLYAKLREAGCDYRQVDVLGKKLSVWRFPVAQANQQTTDFSPPKWKEDVVDEL